MESSLKRSKSETTQMQEEIKEEFFFVKKLSEFATLPTRGSLKSAGYDLHRFVSNFRRIVFFLLSM